MQETKVLSLGWEDPLEKGKDKEGNTHFSILAGRIPWTEEPGRLQSLGLQRVRYDWVTNTLKGTGKEERLKKKTWGFYILPSFSLPC